MSNSGKADMAERGDAWGRRSSRRRAGWDGVWWREHMRTTRGGAKREHTKGCRSCRSTLKGVLLLTCRWLRAVGRVQAVHAVCARAHAGAGGSWGHGSSWLSFGARGAYDATDMDGWGRGAGRYTPPLVRSPGLVRQRRFLNVLPLTVGTRVVAQVPPVRCMRAVLV